MLLHARCRDVAPKDLPSARFDSGTAKTVHANVTGQWMFQKSSAPNQGQSAALVSWSSAPYPPTGADGPSRPVTYYRSFLWRGPGRLLFRKRCGYGATLLGADRSIPCLRVLVFALRWFAATSAPISLSDLYQIPLIRTRGPIGAVRWT